MTKVLVCIPTLGSRGGYLENCLASYRDRTPADVTLKLSVVYDAPTCGHGWNDCVTKGLRHFPDVDYIHFGNDDTVVAEGWLEPLIEATVSGYVPAPRIEPAGVAINQARGLPLDTELGEPPPLPPREPVRTGHGYFYSDLPEHQPKNDWQGVDHGNLPFCSRRQFKDIGPFIPIHYGTDKWFYHRARVCGWPVVARQESVIFNYCAAKGRSKGDWTEQDFLDFDLTVAYIDYVEGRLEPHQEHPQRLTSEGQTRVREWRRRTFG